MPDVQFVAVQIARPKGNFPGQVCEGAFTVADGAVTLTDRKGKPALDPQGMKYSQKLGEGEDARAVAGRLTKKLRLALLGKNLPARGFGMPIAYPKSWDGVI